MFLRNEILTQPEQQPIIPDIPEVAWITAPIVFMVVVMLSTFYLIKKIQKSRMEIQDAVSWIMFNLVLLGFAGFIVFLLLHGNIGTLTSFAQGIGFQSFETLILLIVSSWLWFKTFKLVSRYSQTKYKVTQLSQELAKLKWEVEHNNKKIVEMVNEERMAKKEELISSTLSLEINDKLKYLEHDHEKDGVKTKKIQMNEKDKKTKTAAKKTTKATVKKTTTKK